MRLKHWESAVALVVASLACVFVFSNTSGLGFALLAADALWVLTRVEIVARLEQPGRYTTLRGRLATAKLVFLLAIYCAAVWGFFMIRHDLAANARAAVIADFALAGLCFMLFTELRRSAGEAQQWLVGARAERQVGTKLNYLRDLGCLVLHGYKKDWGGDIDHIVCGPKGAYVIETKSYGFRPGDVRQVTGNAWWLREKLAIPWVTGVLCVAEDHPPELKGRIWIVGHSDLLSWLDAQHNQPVDPERARQVLCAKVDADPVATTGASRLIQRLLA